jgi:hypothetical protein
VLRAGGVAGAVLALAAGAHLAGGGELPGPALLLAVAVVLGALTLLLAGRRFSWPVLSGLLGGGQVALHELFDTCSGVSAQTVAVVSHGHHQSLVAWGDVSSGAESATPAMTLGHVLATAVTTLVLLHGEHVLWSLWAWLRPLVRVLLRLLRFVVARPVQYPAATVPRPRSVVRRRVRRRGPPGVPALATPTS